MIKTVLVGSFMVARLRRRHWARILERWGPDRCTVDTAAFIADADIDAMIRALQQGLHRQVTPETVLTKPEIIAGLRD
jgi:hypothetical protein